MRTCWIVLLAQAAALAAAPVHDSVPVFFIANQGQAPSAVRFMAKSPWITAYFLEDEVVLRASGGTVRMHFEGAGPRSSMEGQQPLSATANFLTGDAEAWRVGVPLFGKVAYRRLYPGIDMVFGGGGRDLKSEFLVAAGADPSRIAMRYEGAGRLRISEDGSLWIPVDGQRFREEAPVIYQERDGVRVPVEGRFRLGSNNTLGFELGQYDHDRPLVIDPVLSYSTLLGGSGFDSATAVAVDSAGSAYVAGFTDSYNFPTLSPAQNYNAGGNDAFVAKLNATGNGLVYCTYIGGSSDDRAYGIAVDSSGNAYVTGSTTSSNFPVRYPLQARLQGSRNAFVVKLNAAGNAMLYSTYLGGGGDYGYGITVDGSGNAYVVGDTTSAVFPATGFQKGFRGVQDAFVAKVSNDGSHLVYSTYLGGSNTDHGAAIGVDSTGSAYVTGSTYSLDFPTLAPMQAQLAGGEDAFIARLNPSGTALLFSTYLGGSNGTPSSPETGQGIALDNLGDAFVVGVTTSPDFPVFHGLQASRAGSQDAFVTKVNSSGALMYSTYLGGSGTEVGNAIAVDSSGSAYVTGYTYSTDLPVVSPLQATIGGDCDAFLAKLSSTGDALLYLSYLGGNGSDTGAGVAVDPSGAVYLAGWTLSTNFPTVNAYQTVNAGNFGAYVAKMTFSQLPGIGGVTPNSGTGVSQTFALQYTDANGASDLTTVSVDFNIAASGVNACVVNFNRALNTLWLLSDAGVQPGSGITPGSGSQQNSQCSLNGAGSTVSISGNTLTLNLSLTFLPAFAGTKSIYMQAVNPNGTAAWQVAGSWTVGGQVQNVSVSPSSGSGSAQTFAFLYNDTVGAGDLTSVSVLVNSSQSTVSGCSVVYTRASNTLALLTDAGALPGTTIAPGSGSQSNSQCTLSGAGSSVSMNGTSLTLNLALTFQPFFGGNKSIYLQAVSPFATAAWQLEGTWNILTQVQLVSVTPGSGSGLVQTFSLQFSDSAGAADISSASILVNSSLSTAAACSVTYTRTGNTLALLTDSGAAPGTAISPGSGSQQNSQCVLNGVGSSVTTSGTTLTVNLALTFQPAFGGSRNVYLQAVAPSGTVAWQQKGSWTIPATVQAVSVTPSSGRASTQTFSFQFSDSAGAASITSVSALFSASLSSIGSCEVDYYRASNTLRLLTDSGGQPSGSLTPGGGSQQNSQCTLNGAGSSVTTSGNTLTLNLSLTFQPTFPGLKNVYMDASDALGTSGWQLNGTWTVPVTVLAVSVTPATGSGTTQTFSFQFSDNGGATDLSSVSALVNAALTATASCEVDYYRASNTLRLLTDSGGQPAGSLTPGSGSQQNSQCILNGAGSSVTTSGNTLTLNLALTFQAAYGGVKNVYMEGASASGNSGWQQKGTWTVPATLQNVSVTPGSGSGASQMFTFQFSDTAGAAALTSVSTLVGAALNAVGSCEVDYYIGTNALRLLTDSGGQPPGSLTPGSGTQQNSQCILNGAGSSASISGNTLTLNLALSFQGAFAGAKNVYMEAASPSGTATWQQKGTWTVPALLQLVSVTPSSGLGASQTFSAQFSDASGATDLTTVSLLINSTASAVSACEVDYNRIANTLVLLTDSGGQPAGGLTPGSGSQQNSQCTLNGAGSSVTVSGNLLTLNVALTFQTSFGGARNVYLEAASASGSVPWLQKGTWTAPATVQAVSVTPGSGNGSTQTFSFQFTDSGGAVDLSSVSILFNFSLNAVGGCEVDYYRGTNVLSLLTDSGGQPFMNISPGSGSQQNSQCLLDGTGSSVSISGNTLTLNLSVNFFTAFQGAKNIYMEAISPAGKAAWQQKGTWTSN
jgi:Beta-propeller repeat